MEMAARFWTVRVCLIVEFDRNGNQASMTNSALGDYMSGKVAHIAGRASENCDLQTTFMVKMHVHRCDRQIMAVVKRPGQPLSQFPFSMIINTDEGTNDRRRIVSLLLNLNLGDSSPGKIANRF